MSYEVTLTPEAKHDLREIYSKDSRYAVHNTIHHRRHR